MPQIILKQPSQNSADFAVTGAVITVAGVVIDCEAREADASQTIEIRLHDGVAQEGGEGALLAQIEIPARRYEDEEGPVGEDGQPTLVRNPLPLDPNRVIVTLWPAN